MTEPSREVQPVPLVDLRGITKRYGDVVACSGVDLALRGGEIHGVLGENGAGKSTLMKVLIGLVQPDEGEIHLYGRHATIGDPQVAAKLGIGMVHQHFSLVDQLSVWENVILGERGGFDRRRARNLVGEIGDRYGLVIDPDARVGALSAGLRQRVELVKCLRRDPRVVVLDEPTSVLTPAESEALFGTLREIVVREGKAVALVSHKLAEVMHATDVVTIMRQGRVVDHRPIGETTTADLARAMVGRDVSLRGEAAALGALDELQSHASVAAVAPPALGPVVLRLSDVSVRLGGVARLDGLGLEVRAGEILGVAGVEGNGQRELGDVLSSLLPLERGTVEVDGVAVRPARAGAMAAAGIAIIPEDRHDSGCVLSMSVAENLVLDRPGTVARRGFLDQKRLRERALQLMEEFEIQASGPDAPLWSLSGGNQQRVVLARELSHRPKVLVAAQPTRGLDVGAIEYMSNRLRAAAADGMAVLLISTELEEILDLADRIVVLSRGAVIGELSRSEASAERLGLLLGGVAGVSTEEVVAIPPKGRRVPAAMAPVRILDRNSAGTFVSYAFFIVLALAIAAFLVAVTGGPWRTVTSALLDGSLRKPGRWGDTLTEAAPLLLVALGSIISTRAGLVNIGQEGQLLFGAACMAFTATRLTGPVGLVFSLAIGFVGGALWAGIAAVLRYWRRVPEVITTLLLVFVAAQLTGYALTKQVAAPRSVEGSTEQDVDERAAHAIDPTAEDPPVRQRVPRVGDRRAAARDRCGDRPRSHAVGVPAPDGR